jgi:hypothetical protein
MLSKNLHLFLRPLENKGLKEGIVTKIGLYDLVKSTTLESNKSLMRMRRIARPIVALALCPGPNRLLRQLIVWPKNSCGLALVVLQQPAKPLVTL